MFIIWTIICLVGMFGLISGALMFWSSPLIPIKNNTHNPLPLLSIIIPARNEEGRIEALLQSLKQQSFQRFELFVVDDGSTDRTDSVAKRYGATVLQNEKVVHMGSGKSHACWTGAKQAKGKWLLFLDADTQFVHETSLETLLLSYLDHGAEGVFSVQPYHKIKQVYENFSAVFNMIVMIGMNIFTPWREKFPAAGAFGPCILCDRENYFHAGGHEKAKTAIMDDFALAKVFRENQFPIFCYGGKGIISFRMYPEGWKQLIEGWAKNFATASKSTHGIVMLFINLWICGGFALIGGLIISFLEPNLVVIVISLFFYLLYTGQTAFLARKTGNFYIWVFPLFPFLLLFFTGVFVYSLYLTKIVRTVTWKGRNIKV
ncbi:glycosyltransferase family 2 protein [Metabacillus halosaccharovorans]|uniref:4,4'-diaponeurosporenoate glycosyltransferase n=1 Tax=Metabacillus halosaccharovorans TaxID=930124 RepID=A0ABT3DHL9_9BACI|nr:glycosyltransferase family 2 protein [Metabacillus halosaccharovorans]MCV9886559.1 glycosyltransferase family 2 protein [Metabacillus halosaccharovorans]